MKQANMLDSGNFDQIIASPLAVVGFGTPWCEVCESQMPILHNLSGRFAFLTEAGILAISGCATETPAAERSGRIP